MVLWPFRIEEHFGSDCMELILALNFTVDGITMAYCGNELADKSRHSMFANRFHRGVYEVADRNSKGEAVERCKVVMKTLNCLKREIDVFGFGKTEWIEVDSDCVLSFERITDTEKVIFTGDFSDDYAEISVPEAKISLSNNAQIEDGKVKLSGFGYLILKVL